jgi:hypothetical protein
MSNANQDRLSKAAGKPAHARITRSLSLAKAIAIAVGISLIGLLVAFQVEAKPELHKQLISASLALLFGACFGGIVKLLLDQYVAEKRRRRSPRVTTSTTDRRLLEGVLSRVLSVTMSSPTYASASPERRKWHDQCKLAKGGAQTAVTPRACPSAD